MTAIHPNPGGSTSAESPYTRKIKRLREDLVQLMAVAPVEHGGVLISIRALLDALIEGE